MRTTRTKRARLLALLVVLMTTAGPARAESALEKAAKADDDAQILLPPVDAFLEPNGQPIKVSLFLEATDQEFLYDVCLRAPRLNEGIFMHFLKARLSRDQWGKLVGGESEAILLRTMNKALGTDWIARVHVVEGEYGTEFAPDTPPPVANGVSCGNIAFREKRIK